MTNLFDERFSTISEWIGSQGLIELGSHEYSSSMVRAIDQGGLVWEGKDQYKSIDAALQDLEKGLKEWMEETGLI